MLDKQTEGREGVPNILFHYTNIDSFKKIIESRRIRATHYAQLNDDSEVSLGIALLREAITNHKVEDSLGRYKDFLLSGIETFQKGDLEIYVLSLSEAADSLDQWRAYAPRGGTAIGFDYHKVRKGFLCDITKNIGGAAVADPIRHDPGNPLMRCIYTDKDGHLDVERIVERLFSPDSYPRLLEKGHPLRQELLRGSLSVAIYRIICSIKHGAYRSEQEWRCVNFRPDREQYPVGLSDANRLFIEMQFDPNEFIKEVWISPHGDKQGVERALNYLKQRRQLGFAIRKSRIPYRG